MEHYPAPKTRAETEAWIAWARDSYESNGFGLWAVERPADGAFLGDCGPMLQPVEGELVPEIGYHIVRREWGRGYATEAATACRDLVLGPARIRAGRVDRLPRELAIARVAEKVHQSMREFIWEKSDRAMCLYETRRPAEAGGNPIPRLADDRLPLGGRRRSSGARSRGAGRAATGPACAGGSTAGVTSTSSSPAMNSSGDLERERSRRRQPERLVVASGSGCS